MTNIYFNIALIIIHNETLQHSNKKTRTYKNKRGN